MNENGSKRRDWVKNAAIVFLTVMLILTFFSNTIMNYSLAEVATKYVTSGTITSQIRGTGTVESGDPYNVSIDETRTIASVLVKTGDEVEKGDTLLLLEDKESDELISAREALESAEAAYLQSVLSGDISFSVVSNVESGASVSVSAYQSKIQAADALIEQRESELEAIEDKIEELTAYQTQLGYSSVDTASEEARVTAAENSLAATAYQKAVEKIAEYDEIIAQLDAVIAEYNNQIVADTEVSGNDYIYTYTVSEEEYQTAKQNREVYSALRSEQVAIRDNETNVAAYNAAVTELNNAKSALTSKENSLANSSNSVALEIFQWQSKLSDAQSALSDAQTARSELLSDIASELSLGEQWEEIAKLQEEVAELEAKAVDAVVTAPISGTISEISLTAGQETTPGSTIITMQPEGAGYTMSITVTSDQAKTLTVGTQADLVNAWRYDDVTVTLTSIKPDPSNPSSSRILNFSISGDVTDGQSLSITIGDKSASYDMVVPNSAIREDSNGKFVLLITQKSGVLSTRYIATRVDVTVLASDDTQSAISGGLYTYDYVITTSTKPVSAGDQVRLAD